MRRTLLTAIAGLAVLAAAVPAHAEGLDQTCELTVTRFDADTTNVLFPDSSAQYWSTRYTAVPGTRLRIDGIYPYARYTSWNVYDPLLRPFAKKSDFELQPDPGSSNPFLPGASRTTAAAQRHYTLFITFAVNDKPGPNTIFIDPTQNLRGVLTLRVYVPDKGRDVTGGVGLPQVTWEPASSIGPPTIASPCRNLQKPSSSTITDLYTKLEGPDGGLHAPGRNPPQWHRFVNLCFAGADLLFDNEYADKIPTSGAPNPCDRFGSGGFLSNMDNAYVYTGISRGHAPIVVFRGLAPTYADTYDPPAPEMPGGVQLRYWSFCQNDPFSQRYISCKRDDQVAVDANGYYTIVVSQPSKWGKPARRQCANATWLPWGPQPQGTMIYRHMLPDASFTQAIQNVKYGQEAAGMGPYYPAARYFKNWNAVAKAYC